MPGVTGAAVRAFLARFQFLYAHHRFGALYNVQPGDTSRIARLLHTYPPARLEAMAVEILTTMDDSWLNTTDRGLGVLATKASWADGRICERAAVKPSKRTYYAAGWMAECDRIHGGACVNHRAHVSRKGPVS